ncbi:MAG TPA: zinc ribbon domain-containing protein [Chthoniobacterales bacterium]|nr:zinc ribbon domain-containing protein [Chthoniobacterales bacterium]
MTRRKKEQPAPAVCPVCGEDVPRGALACPECGADHKSGWREDANAYDGVDLPDEFDYDDFTKREFGSSAKPRGIHALWWITAIVLLVLTLLYFTSGR